MWRIVPPTYLLNAKDECNMMLLKQFTDAYEQHFPDRLKGKPGAQSEAELHQAKLKLRRIFCNSNVRRAPRSSRRSWAGPRRSERPS